MMPTSSRWVRGFISVGTAFSLFEVINLSSPRLGPFHDYHLIPFLYPSRVEYFNFQDTIRERQCQNGTIKDTSRMPGPVPKIVHMVMVVKRPDVDPSPGQFSMLDWLCIQAVLKLIQPDQIKLHYNWIDTENPWYRKVQDKITLMHYDLSDIPMAKSTWHPAHIADVIRLQVLIKEGGIYMDRDIITLRPFDHLLTGGRDLILGFEGGAREGLCNALILSKRSSTFLVRWLSEYKTLDDTQWNYHSVILPQEMAKLYPDELCELSPSTLFYPTWTASHLEYMHTKLSLSEASKLKAQIQDNGGAMYENQMTYHAAGGKQWAKELTPDLVKEVDTPFHILVRQFID